MSELCLGSITCWTLTLHGKSCGGGIKGPLLQINPKDHVAYMATFTGTSFARWVYSGKLRIEPHNGGFWIFMREG